MFDKICLFALEKRNLQIANNRERDLILNGEDILQSPVELLRPEMEAIGDIDELRGNAKAIAGFPDASLQDRLHVQLPSDLPDIFLFSLETKRGRAGDDA